MQKFLYVTIFIFSGQKIFAQDIDKIINAPWFRFSGGISSNVQFNYNSGIKSESPLNYMLSGSLNPEIKGFAVPLSFSYSNQNMSYSNPFNQFQFAPSYKWLHSYFGSVNMSFSPHTLNGSTINGFGIECNLDIPIKLAVVAGTLVKPHVSINDEEAIVVLKRNSWGVKFDYEAKKITLGYQVFHAKDIEKSVNIIDSLMPKPMENTAIAITANTTVGNVQVAAEIGVSEICSNILFETSQRPSLPSLLTGIYMKHRMTSAVYNAVKFTVGYDWINFSYEKTDPEYQTFGSLYATNDMENITLSLNRGFNKLNLSGSLGLQCDDLDNEKASKMKNIVVNGNASYQFFKQFATQLSYSNFHSSTRQKPVFDEFSDVTALTNPDSLKFIQLAQTFNFSMNYQWDGRKNNNTLVYNFSFQDTRDKHLEQQNVNNQSANHSINFNSSNKKGENMSASFSFMQQKNNINSLNFGCSLSYGKPLFNKTLKMRYMLGYNNTFITEKSSGSALSFKISSSYSFRKKHQFMLNMGNTLKKNNAKIDFSSNVNLSYSYQF